MKMLCFPVVHFYSTRPVLILVTRPLSFHIDHISHVPPGKFPIIIYLHPAGYGHRILLRGLNFRLKVTKLS